MASNRFDDLDDLLPEDAEPNTPLVPVKGVNDKDVWRLFERYRIQFTPPTDNERKLCEVIVALEELVGDQEATITRLRQRPAPPQG